MEDIRIPAAVGTAVAEFVRARSREYPRGAPLGVVSRGQRHADAALVHRYDRAITYGHRVTAESLASVLLTVALSYADHPDYQPGWKIWESFGDLSPVEGTRSAP